MSGLRALVPPARRERLEHRLGSAGTHPPARVASAPIPERLDSPHRDTSRATARTATFRLEGHFWTVADERSVVRLKDCRGLRYIGVLLRHPARDFHALDLVAHLSGIRPTDRRGAPSIRQTFTVPRWSGNGDAALDAQARSAYKRRLEEVREELVDAEHNNDLGHTSRLRHEFEFLPNHLTAATSLGGRNRFCAEATERARIAVTKRIKDALQRVIDGHPDVGLHLRRAVRTGLFCTYVPDPYQALDWRL